MPSNTVYIKACQRYQRLSLTSSTCFNIHRMWCEALSLRFPKLFFQIENPLSIKEIMSQNVCVCSFPIFNIHSITALRCIWSIFDIFDIHIITALRCIWSIFDIFDISNIHSITALRYIWSIFDIFDIDSITCKWYHIKKVMITMCLYVLFPSSTYIALQPLGVFDVS